MSTCISKHGEFSSHEPDGEWTCTLCGVLDEDGLRAEVERLTPFAGPGPFEPDDDGFKAPTWQELRALADHNFRLYCDQRVERDEFKEASEERAAAAEAAEAEVRALREGIKALALNLDRGDSIDRGVAGELRALLAPPPAATTGETDQGSHSRLAAWGGAYRDETNLVFCQRCGAAEDNHYPGGSRYGSCEFLAPSPAPVSSGEAGLSDLDAIKREDAAKALTDAAFDLDIPNTQPHTREDSIGAAGAPDWLRARAAAILRGPNTRPAPVVAPSAEGESA